MPGFPGKRFSWLLTGSARFDPAAGTRATSILPPRASAAVPHTLADKLEGLVQAAYDAGDRGTGRHLAIVLRNMQRRTGQGGPLSTAWASTQDLRADLPARSRSASRAAPRAAPRAANDP